MAFSSSVSYSGPPGSLHAGGIGSGAGGTTGAAGGGGNSGSSGGVAGAAQDNNYSSFPIISVDELISVLSEIGLVGTTPDDVNRPTFSFAQTCLYAFVECLSNANGDALERYRSDLIAGAGESKDMYDEALSVAIFTREM